MARERQASTEPAPRRIVLLAGDERSDVAGVCADYRGREATGTRIHADLQKFAADNPGRTVAAEWEGPLGWTRYLWCRK